MGKGLCQWSPEKNIGFPGAGVSGSCEQSDRRAGSELGSPLQEQYKNLIH